MDNALEASPQRVRHHLRRPLAGSRNQLMKTAGNTLNETVPVLRSPLEPAMRSVYRRELDVGE
jgi:hypothetical protein